MIYLYSNLETHDVILELWGASTKHPDSRFFFSDFKLSEYVPNPDPQIFQWVLECASKLNFPFHARDLAEFALRCDDAYIKYCELERRKQMV